MAYICVDGISLYYDMPRGRGDKVDDIFAMLIHGGGGSSKHWEPLLEHLPQQFCPLLIDLPGHGHSSGTVPHSVPEATTFLEHLLQQLEVQQPFWCIGHSIGGLIAQYFALRFPSRVEQLVLIATSARIRLHPDFIKSALSGLWDLEMFRPSFGADIPIEIQNLVLNEYPKLRVDASSMDFMGASAFNLMQEIPTITLPVLVIGGDDDVIVSPRHTRMLAQALPEATLLTIPHGGHYVQVEQPKYVAQIIAHYAQEQYINYVQNRGN
jgi:pimeloyl-ACP methyl ester carboxylesterase